MDLQSLWAAARTAHPEVRLVDEAEFGRRMAEAAPGCAADVYLALACAAGDARAHRGLDQILRNVVPPAAARVRASNAFVEEVEQRLRHKLLIGGPDRKPKIAAYAGRGPLGSWLRAAALREALNLVDGEKEERVAEEGALGRLAAGGDDPELDLVRRRYAPEFKTALDSALHDLPAKERNLLRLYFVQGLTVEQIGRMEGTHKSTVSRWLAKTRAALLKDVKARLGAALKVTPSELDSLIGVLRSQLHLSLHRALS